MQRRIITATDFSETSEAALPFAADLAARFDATLSLLHVLPELPDLVRITTAKISSYHAAIRDQATNRMKRLSEASYFKGVTLEAQVLPEAAAAPTIVGQVESTEACLAVMSTHGRRGAARLLLGSVTEEVVRTSPAPVLTVGTGAELWSSSGRILVPVDFSPASVFAVEAAARLSRLFSWSVHLVHVMEPTESPAMQEAFGPSTEPPRAEVRASALEKLAGLAVGAGLGNRYQTCTAFGGAKERILDMADRLDPSLLVLGSHGRRGLGRVVLGSVAEGIVRESRRPTLVVKDGKYLDTWPATVPASSRTVPANGASAEAQHRASSGCRY